MEAHVWQQAQGYAPFRWYVLAGVDRRQLLPCLCHWPRYFFRLRHLHHLAYVPVSSSFNCNFVAHESLVEEGWGDDFAVIQQRWTVVKK